MSIVMGIDVDCNPIRAVFATELTAMLKRRKITHVALKRRITKHATSFAGSAFSAHQRDVFNWCNGTRRPRREDVELIADCLFLTGNERARLFAAAGLWPDEWDLPTTEAQP